MQLVDSDDAAIAGQAIEFGSGPFQKEINDARGPIAASGTSEFINTASDDAVGLGSGC